MNNVISDIYGPAYEPARGTRFLWWLSTAEPELLKECVVDRNRYAIVGMTVLATWSFATLAWTYFFSTVTTIVPAILLGLFMGGIILTIDRALIKGITRTNRNRFLPLAFRGALAIVIGLFMAQPAILYLFDKEVRVQVSLDNEQRKKDKLQKQDSVYVAARSVLTARKKALQDQLDARYAEVGAARENFIRETDGTGGSGKVGLKDIAQAKQREYLKLDQEYRRQQALLLPSITSTDSSLAAIDASEQKEQAAFSGLLNDGFITRIEALNHLVQNNSSVAFRYYLLVLILLLIELMPVISKLLLPAGTYEEKLSLREDMEKQLARSEARRELELRELDGETAFEKGKALIVATEEMERG